MARFSGLKTGTTHTFTLRRVEDLEITCLDEAGAACARWHYVLENDDDTRRTGQLDANGYVKFSQLPVGAPYRFKATPRPVAEDAPPAPKAPPPPAPKAPPAG